MMEELEAFEDKCSENGISEMDTLEWKKMCRVISGGGFREGALAGKEAAFQKGFDTGYAEGFQNGFLLGHIKGIVRIAGNEEELRDELASSELSKASRGCCLLCANKEHLTSPEVPNQLLRDIIQKQKHFIHTKFKSVQNKNADFVTKWNISELLNCTDQGNE